MKTSPTGPIVTTLPDDRVCELFRQEVLPDWLLPQLPTTPARHPTAIVIGGQPGAGKTSASEYLAPAQDFATVNGDNLRAFHPQFNHIINHHPEQMADLTTGVAGQLVAASITWLTTHRFNLTWETTFRSGGALERDLAQTLYAGYNVELWALAVPGPVSLEATVARWAAEVKNKGVGRPVSLTGHDEPYEAAPALLRHICEELPDVALHIVDRAGTTLYTPGGGTPDSALATGRLLTPETATQLHHQVEKTTAEVRTLPPSDGRRTALTTLDIVKERMTRDISRAVRRTTWCPRIPGDSYGM